MFHEQHSRTILKSITWRIIAIISTFTVIQILTHDYQTSLYYTLIINLVKSFLYYVHERLWNKSSFGLRINNQ